MAMIEEFVTWLQATGRSQATQQTYRRWVQRWLAAAPPGHELSPGGMRKFVLSDTVRRRRDGALAAAATQNDARAALRALGRWAVATGRRDADPAAEIGLLAAPRGADEPVLTDATLRTVLERALRPSEPTARDGLLVALLAVTGLRLAEVVALTNGDLDRSRRLLRVQRRKGGAREWLPAPRAVVDLAEQVEPGERDAKAPLISARGGGFLSIRQAQVRFRQWCDANGLAGAGLTPRALRRSFAEHIYRRTGNDLRLTSLALGHRHPWTTARYLALAPPTVEREVRALAEDLCGPTRS